MMHLKHETARNAQRGFALVLVLAFLAIAAMVIGTMLSKQQNEATWSPVTGTKDRLDAVQHALAAYERAEHRLPMPAMRTEAGGIALHVEALPLLDGAENNPAGFALKPQVVNQFIAGAASVELAGGVFAVSSDPTNLRQIMIVGAVPTQTLGLPRSAAEDESGHLLTYAVTFEMLDRFKYKNATGVIALKDVDGNVVANDMAYVLLSHGKNARGAWSAKNRNVGRECGAGAAGEDGDSGNCAFDGASFVVHDLTLIRGDGYFDDQLVRGGKDRVALSQNQSCLGPIDVTWTDPLCPTCSCDGKIPLPGLASVGTKGEPTSIDLEDTTPSDIGEAKFECKNGAVELVENSNNCTRPCNLPWGGTLENGDSVMAYSTSSVPCGDACPSPVARMCVNGMLTGTGDHPSCSEAAGCNPQNGTCAGPFPTGNGPSNPVYGFCASGTKTGDNGLTGCGDTRTWTCQGEPGGTSTNCYFDYDACGGGCSLPWGGSINDGESVQAYSADSVACGETCPTPTTRTCTNGVLSGSGDHEACEVLECGNCALPWGGSLDDGESVQAYSASSVACGQTCAAPTTRTCTNGVLSGSGDHQACEVAECGSCALPWGGSINDGESVQAYSASSVACGETCPAATTRTCTNGTLSGSGDHAGCMVTACASCDLPWGGNIAHGASVTAFFAPATNGCQCLGQQRVCTNGVLSGAYTHSTCQELGCAADCNAGGGDGCVLNGQVWTTKCRNGWKWTYRCENGSNTQLGGGTDCPGDEMCF